MSDFKRICELASKINNLLDAVQKNNGQFSALDKDLATNYVRELYERLLTIQPATTSSNHVINEKETIVQKEHEVKPLEIKNEQTGFGRELHEPLVTELKTEKQPVPVVPIANGVEEKKESKADPVILHETKKSVSENGSKKSISEIYAEKTESSQVTLNEKYKSEGKIIADKLKQTPIRDLKAYIGLNKRFTFINTLFNGSEKNYEEAISKVNGFKNYEEAIKFIRDQLLSNYEWSDDEPLVSEFFTLVMRRYLN